MPSDSRQIFLVSLYIMVVCIITFCNEETGNVCGDSMIVECLGTPTESSSIFTINYIKGMTVNYISSGLSLSAKF